MTEPQARPSITCPKCGLTSRHPKDVEEGYCGNCHDWTGKPSLAAVAREIDAAVRDDVETTRRKLNEALAAIERGDATDEQVALMAAFDATLAARLNYQGPTFEGRPLPEPILRAFIELVRGAGGEIRVPERILTDPEQYELVVVDDPATCERVFRVRPVEQ